MANYGEKLLDFILKKKNLYLILIIVLALVLRVNVAMNVEPLADEMNVAVRSINVHESGTINSVDQSHSFYYLTEIFYKIFGNINLITARGPSIFFGLLSILMIYLIAKKLYKSEKIALVSAFLVAISGFQLRFSLAEMDITMAFFVLLSSYCFLIALYEKKEYMYYVSSLFLGLAIAVKTFAGIWILSYLCFAIYYNYKKTEEKKIERYVNKKTIKISLIFIFIIFLIVFPTLIANYLLYKDRGIVDLQFARFLDINKEYYAGLSGIDSPFMLSQLGTGTMAGLRSFWNYDAVISLMALFGFIGLFKKYKEQHMFLFFWFLFAFLFIAGTAWLRTHFVFHTLIFSILASVFLIEIKDKITENKQKVKRFIPIALIGILIVNLWVVGGALTSQTAVTKMRNYAIDNIQENELVIVDSRLFRGRTAFIFHDKNYLEAIYFPQAYNEFGENAGGNVQRITTYFVECVKDDCGWGNIKDQPELNNSMEILVETFNKAAYEKATIYGGGGSNEMKNEEHFKIYKTDLMLNTGIFNYIKQTHTHYLYPVNWKGEIYDKYNVYNSVEDLLNDFGFLIFYITIGLEVLSPLIIFWFFYREKSSFNGSERLPESNEVVQ